MQSSKRHLQWVQTDRPLAEELSQIGKNKSGKYRKNKNASVPCTIRTYDVTVVCSN